MSDGADDTTAWLAHTAASIDAGSFVRVTLGKFRGKGEAQKLVVTRVMIKDAPQLRFVTSRARQDATQNHQVADGLARLNALIGDDYLSATLFTTDADWTLAFSKKKLTRLTASKPTFSTTGSTEHNRAKQYAVDPARAYLRQLGVTLDDGRVKPSMYPKFKQICHFIEIASVLLRESELADKPTLSVVDIGSGKGYLTFALYDYLTATLGKTCDMTGVEVRPDLVGFCSDLAKRVGFQGLHFRAELAASAHSEPVDAVIALHACDTATDDAIARGIHASAALIICAPCCQHELAPQLSKPGEAFAGLMKFGLFKQRQADLFTDAARCLLMESSGYQVKVIEFVSTEHTAKNILISGVRSRDVDRDAATRQYTALKNFSRFAMHRLEDLLKPR